MYIENIVIGAPVADFVGLLSNGDEDWENEKRKTLFTSEVFLPHILVHLGIAQSTSEIRRSRNDLWREILPNNFETIKIGKRRLWIVS